MRFRTKAILAMFSCVLVPTTFLFLYFWRFGDLWLSKAALGLRSGAQLELPLSKLVTGTVLIVGLSLILALILARALSSGLSTVLNAWTEQTRGLTQDTEASRNFTLAALRKDEIGIMARSLRRTLTDLRHMRQELRKTERLAAIGQFSAAIAHEIKNPLSVILSHAQLGMMQLEAAQYPNGDSLVQNLEHIERESRRAHQVLLRLMSLARNDKVPIEVIDLSQTVRRSITTLRGMAELAGVTLVESTSQERVPCRADSDQIHELLVNLVQNALHALEQSREKRLWVSVSVRQSTAVLEVKDSGHGIPTETRARLFEPFFTTKPVGQGTGLGLAICQRIVTNHHGKISVHSQREKGTIFRVALPLAKDNEGFGKQKVKRMA